LSRTEKKSSLTTRAHGLYLARKEAAMDGIGARDRAIKAVLFCAALSALGCARYSGTPVAVYGPYRRPDVFEVVASALVARGYPILEADPGRGVVRVQLRESARGRPVTVRFQVFRE